RRRSRATSRSRNAARACAGAAAAGSEMPSQVLRRPIARLQEVLQEPRLRAALLRPPVVVPAHERRQGHQDRLGPAARLEAEERAPVVDQVELDVAPAPVELPAPLALAVRRRPPAYST